MNSYKALDTLTKLQKQTAQISAYIQKRRNRSANLQGDAAKKEKDILDQAESTMEVVSILQNRVNTLYSKNKKGAFKILSGQDVEELKGYYDYVSQSFTAMKQSLFPSQKLQNGKEASPFREAERILNHDKEIVKHFRADDGLTLPAATFKSDAEIRTGQYANANAPQKWPGFYEYARMFTTDPNITEDMALQMYINSTPEQIRNEYQQAVQTNPRMYEYPSVDSNIDLRIKHTGDINAIDQYLQEDNNKQNPEEKLTYRDRFMLQKHRETAVKVQEIQDNARQQMDARQEIGTRPNLLVDRDDAAELDIHQTAHQSSGCGCWSCAGALMAKSRGMGDITQEDIRFYRPNIPQNEVVLRDGDVDYNYGTDDYKSIVENADSVLKYAPNSMMRSLEIQPFTVANERDGYSSDQYVKNTVQLLKKQILHAIREDRSPVSFFMPGHYITITGINGDIVRYKDSLEMNNKTGNPDESHDISLEDLVTNSFFRDRPHSVEISWLSDIKLANDHKTIHGVPSEYVYMNPDGSVTQQPESMRAMGGDVGDHPLNRMGVRVMRPADDEMNVFAPAGVNRYGSAGVQYMERVYLPKQLDAEYLKTMADNRDAQAEQKLVDADRDLYHIKPGKTDPALAEPAMHQRLLEFEQQRVRPDFQNRNPNQIPNPAPDPNLNPNPGPNPNPRPNPDPGPKSESEKEQGKPGGAETSGEKKGPEQSVGEPPKKEGEKGSEQPEKMVDDTRPKAERRSKDDFDIGGKDHSAEFERTLVKNPEKRMDALRQNLEIKEKELYRQLKSKYKFSGIKETADRLATNLNANKHWYLWGATPEYKLLLGQMDIIQRTSEKAAAADPNHPFTEEDARKMVNAIDRARNAAKTYLSSKQKEMEKDPRRKNDPGNKDVEQARIRTVLDVFENLSEMQMSLRPKSKTAGILQANEDWKADYNEFQDVLVSNAADAAENQKASFKDRIYIPKGARKGLDRLEDLFGMERLSLKEFSDVKALDNIKPISRRPKAIGSGKKTDMISNKDFVALAAAASTTMDCDTESRRDDPAKRFTREEAHAYRRMDILRAAAGVPAKEPDGSKRKAVSVEEVTPGIVKARDIANRALKAYHRGDKKPLAKLIAEGIKNMTSIGHGRESSDLRLYSAEMGHRMWGMLDRDRELMDLALNSGLKPEMLKHLKNQKIEAANAAAADRMAKEGLKAAPDEWGIRTKERNYVELLMKTYLGENGARMREDLKDNAEYTTKRNAILTRDQRESKALKDAYDKEILRIMKPSDAYAGATKVVTESLVMDVEQIDRTKMSRKNYTATVKKMKGDAEKKMNSEILRNAPNIVEAMERQVEFYEAKLLAKHQTAIGEQAKSLGVKVEEMDPKLKMEVAIEQETAIYTSGKAPKDPEQKNKFDRDKAAYRKYQNEKSIVNQYRRAENLYNKRAGNLRDAKNIALNALDEKYLGESAVGKTLSDPGKEREIRGRLRDYIRGNGYINYSPELFIEKIVGVPGKTPPTVRDMELSIELVRFESRPVTEKVKAMDKADAFKKPEITGPRSKDVPAGEEHKSKRVNKLNL